MNEYEWSSAIITGGGTGLGKSIALRLADAGVHVNVWGRRVDLLEETCSEIESRGGGATPVACDITAPDQVDAAIERSSRSGEVPGILVNNAAGAFVEFAERISPSGWAAVLGSSLTGVFHVSRAWNVARTANAEGGTVLNVTSATVDNGSPGTAHSGAAKAGVASLTKTLALEWARFGIRVNTLAPGAFVTAGGAQQIWNDPRIEQRILSAVPMGRFANVEEIAGPACFLLSAEARYITGATLKVDGGWTLTKWLYSAPDD